MTTVSPVLRILHLSDLHISDAEIQSQRIVLQALWADIERNGDRPFDLILFSGDLIAKGAYTETNQNLVRSDFIEPLLGVTKLGRDRLFIVPGNHDVQVNTRSKYVPTIHDAIDSQDKAREYFKEAAINPLPDGLGPFNSFLGSLGLAKPVLSTLYYHAYKVDVNGMSVGVCCINSAWKATGRPNNADYGSLVIGRSQLDELVAAVSGVDLVLGVFHHPNNWLALFDQAVVMRQLYTHFDAVFFGHNHEGDGTLLAGSTGSFFASNAGCLYQHRDYFNGYSILEFNSGRREWVAQAREYFESRQSFDRSLRFANDGQQTYSVVARNGSGLQRFPTIEFIEAVKEVADAHLLSSQISGVAPRSLERLFIDPPLARVSQRQVATEGIDRESANYVSLRELLAGHSPIVFIGAKQAGKTTLLHHICCQSSQFGLTGLPPFSAYVDLRNALNTRSKLLDEIVRFSGNAYRRAEFIELLRQGLVALCFDNVDEADARQIEMLAEFSREFPSCRYFFSYREDMEASVTSETLPKIMDSVEVIYLHLFGRKETRSLAARWFGESDPQISEKVDEILASLGRLNVPRTPFLISALLWIKESQLEFTPVNRSAILDALIDGVLDKVTESKGRDAFDSTIKRHFLASLTEHLFRHKVRGITQIELEKFAIDYFERRLLDSAVGPFLGELKAKGLLVDIGEHVVFKFDCIRAYFLSLRLKESPELLELALSEESVLHFAEELDYYTGAKRDDEGILRRCLRLLQRFRERANLNIELSYFDDVSVHESPFTQEMQAELAGKIIGDRLQGEKREQLLDRLDRPPTPTYRDNAAFSVIDRPSDPFRDFVAVTQVCSTVLRNSELVEDGGLKRDAYNQVSECWSEVMIAMLVAVEFLEDDPRALDAIRGVLPDGNVDFAKYLLKVIAPNVVLNHAVEFLGTQKLQRVVEESFAGHTLTVRNVLDVFLHVDLALPGRFNLVDELLEKQGSKRFVSELIFFKLTTIFLFGRLYGSEEKEVKDLIGRTLSVVATARTNVAKHQLKDRVLAKLEKSRLLRDK